MSKKNGKNIYHTANDLFDPKSVAMETYQKSYLSLAHEKLYTTVTTVLLFDWTCKWRKLLICAESIWAPLNTFILITNEFALHLWLHAHLVSQY